MLRRPDRFEFIEVYQQIVRQRHLLIELIRQIEVIQIILTKLWRQQTMIEGGLTTSLRTY